MDWWEILKVDIDFNLQEKQKNLFGLYEKGQLDLFDFIREVEELYGGTLPPEAEAHYAETFYNKLKRNAEFAGKPVEMKDVIQERITINPVPIFNRVKDIMGKEPTDQQLIDFIVSTIMHEGTHAGMSEEQDFMTPSQSEYGAFVGQFPNNTFYRLKQFTQHKDNIKQYLPRSVVQFLGVNPKDARSESRFSKRAELIVGYILSLTDKIKPKLQQRKYQERLARLEILAIKKDADFLGDIMDWAKSGSGDMIDVLLSLDERYKGIDKPEDRKMYRDIINSVLDGAMDSFEKTAMTVTTTNSPAMFNNKAIRRKKKRDEDGEG